MATSPQRLARKGERANIDVVSGAPPPLCLPYPLLETTLI